MSMETGTDPHKQHTWSVLGEIPDGKQGTRKSLDDLEMLWS